MATAADRLATQLEEAEEEILKLKDKLHDIEYQNRWQWRHLFNLTDKQNLDLPVPRLELRYIALEDGFECDVKYGLVHEHLLGEIEFVPISSTRVSGGTSKSFEGVLDLPFRAGADMYYDMYCLKLPGYVVNGKKYKELDLNDRMSLPNALLAKMDGKPWKKREVSE